MFVYPVEEQIHRAHFRYLVVLAIQPEDLLTAILHCLALRQKGRAIIASEENKTIDDKHRSPHACIQL